MKSLDYKAMCTIKVLALGDRIYKNEVVRFTIKQMLPIKDYGIFNPEGWEYDIDDEQLYNTGYYIDKMMEDMELVRPNNIVTISRSRNLDLKQILSVVITEIDLTKTEDILND